LAEESQDLKKEFKRGAIRISRISRERERAVIAAEVILNLRV